MITNIRFRNYFSTSNSIYLLDLKSIGFVLIIFWYALLHLRSAWSNVSISKLILILVHWYCSHTFTYSYRSFSNYLYAFIKCWIDFYIIALWPWFHWSFVKFTGFFYSYLFGVCLGSSKIFFLTPVFIF